MSAARDREEEETVIQVPKSADGRPLLAAEPSRSGSAATPTLRGQTGSTTGMTVATTHVMQSEEVSRARAFFRLTAVMVLVAAGFMPFVPGPTSLRAIAMTSCLIAAGAGLWVVRLIRDETRYTPRLVLALGIVFGVTGELSVFYFGPFTAAVMVLPLGVYFFGLSESEHAARTTYLVGAVLFLVLTLGVVLGVLPDLGPLPVGDLPTIWKAFFVVMIQIAFATTYFLARSSRRSTQAALSRVERAHRQLVQRDALLDEARGELARALKPGEGRYTGEVVDGYRFGDVVGRGGMGEVYRARHEESGEELAFKLLHPFVLSDPEMVKRFDREAEIAKRVDSDHVARVRTVGHTPSGLPFVAMELLEGHDLAWHLRKAGRLRPAAVAEMVRHAASALSAIREAGIVHRDLKPQNIVLVERPKRMWKVLDFGVSRFEGGGATLTREQIVGTPSYMAPEQAGRGKVDHRADVYALAAVAFRALTGKPAFSGDDPATVLYRVIHVAPASPRTIVELHEDVELVLSIGLAKDPDQRFQTAEELGEALDRAVRGALDEASRERGHKQLAACPWLEA